MVWELSKSERGTILGTFLHTGSDDTLQAEKNRFVAPTRPLQRGGGETSLIGTYWVAIAKAPAERQALSPLGGEKTICPHAARRGTRPKQYSVPTAFLHPAAHHKSCHRRKSAPGSERRAGGGGGLSIEQNLTLGKHGRSGSPGARRAAGSRRRGATSNSLLWSGRSLSPHGTHFWPRSSSVRAFPAVRRCLNNYAGNEGEGGSSAVVWAQRERSGTKKQKKKTRRKKREGPRRSNDAHF